MPDETQIQSLPFTKIPKSFHFCRNGIRCNNTVYLYRGQTSLQGSINTLQYPAYISSSGNLFVTDRIQGIQADVHPIQSITGKGVRLSRQNLSVLSSAFGLASQSISSASRPFIAAQVEVATTATPLARIR